MDSSRSDQATSAGFRPWQIHRIRSRLSHYKASSRHGWERIATDILFEEELPAAYVDSEEVRPLSESLRRLENGSQTPSTERLNAISLFLIKRELLRPEDLVEKDASRAAPLAFAEFTSGNLSEYEDVCRQFAQELSGTYSSISREEGTLIVHELSIVPDGTILGVAFSRAAYNDPAGQMTLTNNRNRRNHAVIRERIFTGWAAIISGNQIVLMLREALFDRPSTCYLLYATEGEEIARKLLILPYVGISKYTDFDAIPFPSEQKPTISVTQLYERTTPSGFQIFSRDTTQDE